MELLLSMLHPVFHMGDLIWSPQDSFEVDVLFPASRRRNKAQGGYMASSRTHRVFEPGFRPRELEVRVHDLA